MTPDKKKKLREAIKLVEQYCRTKACEYTKLYRANPRLGWDTESGRWEKMAWQVRNLFEEDSK